MIYLENVSKVYGSGATAITALDSVSLTVETGEFLSIMGPSGSGKSTMLNLLAALDAPSSGTILLAGQASGSMTDDALTAFRRRNIGLVFQFFNLLPTLNVLDNVLLPVLLERKATREDRAEARRLLIEVGLGARLEHRIHQLSGGEMQRVAIARALVLNPRLVLADEPTGNLDSVRGEVVLKLLRTLCERRRTTMVMVTHDEAAARFGDRVVRMKDGRVVSDEGVPHDVELLADEVELLESAGE